MKILSFIAFRVVSGKPGYPIHSTEGMPEELITLCAPAGAIFLILVYYSHYKDRVKRKTRYRQLDETWDQYVKRKKRQTKK